MGQKDVCEKLCVFCRILAVSNTDNFYLDKLQKLVETEVLPHSSIAFENARKAPTNFFKKNKRNQSLLTNTNLSK